MNTSHLSVLQNTNLRKLVHYHFHHKIYQDLKYFLNIPTRNPNLIFRFIVQKKVAIICKHLPNFKLKATNRSSRTDQSNHYGIISLESSMLCEKYLIILIIRQNRIILRHNKFFCLLYIIHLCFCFWKWKKITRTHIW